MIVMYVYVADAVGKVISAVLNMFKMGFVLNAGGMDIMLNKFIDRHVGPLIQCRDQIDFFSIVRSAKRHLINKRNKIVIDHKKLDYLNYKLI